MGPPGEPMADHRLAKLAGPTILEGLLQRALAHPERGTQPTGTRPSAEKKMALSVKALLTSRAPSGMPICIKSIAAKAVVMWWFSGRSFCAEGGRRKRSADAVARTVVPRHLPTRSGEVVVT